MITEPVGRLLSDEQREAEEAEEDVACMSFDIYMNICTYARMYISMYTCMYVCIYLCIRTCMYACVHACSMHSCMHDVLT